MDAHSPQPTAAGDVRTSADSCAICSGAIFRDRPLTSDPEKPIICYAKHSTKHLCRCPVQVEDCAICRVARIKAFLEEESARRAGVKPKQPVHRLRSFIRTSLTLISAAQSVVLLALCSYLNRNANAGPFIQYYTLYISFICCLSTLWPFAYRTSSRHDDIVDFCQFLWSGASIWGLFLLWPKHSVNAVCEAAGSGVNCTVLDCFFMLAFTECLVMSGRHVI